MRRAVTGMLAAAALAGATLLGGAAGQASPGAHIITGNGIAGPWIVTGLGATEVPAAGSATITGTPVTITCVDVQVVGPVASHVVSMRAVGGGQTWYLTIREDSGLQTLLVTQTVNPTVCGTGQPGFTGLGLFSITP